MHYSLTDFTHALFWLVWAAILVIQNMAFTLVSRARNSGSLQRHMFAAMLSNGVWFISQIFAFGTITAILTGKFGWKMGACAGVFYTTFTLIGSLVSHAIALRTESGKTAVGSNKKYKQVTVEEWEKVQRIMSILPTDVQKLHVLRDVIEREQNPVVGA
jgi:hypothetical protein